MEAEYVGTFDVSTPHPLLFNKHGTDHMEIEGLRYSELSTHFGVAYLLVVSDVELDPVCRSELF